MTLADLLKFLMEKKRINGFGSSVSVIFPDDQSVIIDSAYGKQTQSLYRCPTTSWKYFYATLGVDLLDSDDESNQKVGLQPRYLIKDKVFSLFRHFQGHPVLQPSIGRIYDSKVRLFDGQHKIAGLLMAGRTVFECKIYIDPDLKLLNDTNIAAHDAFAQTRFYSSIMVLKLGAEFAKEFEEFKNSGDGSAKSESSFFTFLLNNPKSIHTKADLSRRFRSHLYRSVLKDPANKMDAFVSAANRSTDETPITIDMLEKSIFANFLVREPTLDSMVSDEYRRDDEQQNLLALCNMLVDEGLCNWKAKAPADEIGRIKLRRIFGSKSMMAWAELLWDAVCGKLDLHDTDDRHRVFYRRLSNDDMEKVRKIVRRLFEWQRWIAPKDDEIDRILSDKKSAVKEWFRAHGLTTGYLMGASV